MTDATALALIIAVPTTISTALNFIIQFRQTKNHTQVTRQLDSLTQSTNGKMEELLRIIGSSEHAKGVLEGKKEG